MMQKQRSTDDNMNTVLPGGYHHYPHHQQQQQQQHHYGYQNNFHHQQQQQPPPPQQQQHYGGGGYRQKQMPQQFQSMHPGPPVSQHHPHQQQHHHQQQQHQPPPGMMGGPPMMQYRDVSRNSPYPQYPQQQPQYPMARLPGLTDDDDGQNYGNDRIQNDLLDEICSDFGIKDAMDLDFFDFDGSSGPYMFTGGMGNPNSGQTELEPGFTDISSQPLIGRTDNEKLAIAGLTRVDSPSSMQAPPPSSGSSSVATGSKSDHEKVDSPTISSSSSEDCGGATTTGQSKSSTAGLPAGSPLVHSTTPCVEAGRPSSVDASEPSPIGSTNADTGSSSSCASASLPAKTTTQRSSSVESPATPASPRPSGTLSKTSGFTATIKHNDLYTSFSQPASPAKNTSTMAGKNANPAGLTKAHSMQDNLHLARSLANHAAFQNSSIKTEESSDSGFKVPQGPVSAGANRASHAHKLLKENLPARASESPYDGGYYSTGSPSVCASSSSHYGSASNLSTATSSSGPPQTIQPKEEAKDTAELKLSSLPSTADLSIPSLQGGSGDGNSSGASSQPDSPSAMHVAKRARIINSGSELLEEMRERYSFVKGASIYDQGTKQTMPSNSGAGVCNSAQPQSSMSQQQRPPNSPAIGGPQAFNFPDDKQPMQRSYEQQNYAGNMPNMGQPNMSGSQHNMSASQPPNMPPGGPGNMSTTGQPNMPSGAPNMATGGPPNMPQHMPQGAMMGPGGDSSYGGPPQQYGYRQGPNMPYNQQHHQQMQQQQHWQQQQQYGGNGGANPMLSSHNMNNRSQYMDNNTPGGGGGNYNMGQQPMGGMGGMGGMGNNMPHPMQQQQQQGMPNNMLYNNMPPHHHQQQQQHHRQMLTASQDTFAGAPPTHQPLLPQDPSKPMTAQQGLMHSIINDGSSAFHSHPLFPLLRDLIIADMNFHTPSFPFQLIANLPTEFDKLLMNYQNRNPPNHNYPVNTTIEKVIMDALRYAHQSLIEKIQVKKREVGYQETPKPLTAIEDFCERFERAVKNTMTNDPTPPPPPTGMSSYPPRPSGSLPSTPSKSKTSQDSDKPKTTATAGRNKVLPKEAVSTMLEWLREHQDNPYPNDDEKEMLINKTKLTINQINYWFTNARRRILPKWALQRYMEQQQQQQRAAGPGPPQPPPQGPYRGMTAS